jgi:hypothetical protein
VPAKSSSRSRNQAARFMQASKVLNLRADSKRLSAVIFRSIVQNKFINCLRLSEPTGFFEQPIAAMPISDYASAFFFARLDRVTPKRCCAPSVLSACNRKSVVRSRIDAERVVPSSAFRAGLVRAHASASVKIRHRTVAASSICLAWWRPQKKRPGVAGPFAYFFDRFTSPAWRSDV